MNDPTPSDPIEHAPSRPEDSWLDPVTALSRLWRPRFVLPGLLLLAAIVWAAMHPWVVSRTIEIEFRAERVATGEAEPLIALEWRRSSDGVVNGRWLSEEDLGPQRQRRQIRLELPGPNYATDFYALRWSRDAFDAELISAKERTEIRRIPLRSKDLPPLDAEVEITSHRFAGAEGMGASGAAGSPPLGVVPHAIGTASVFALLLLAALVCEGLRRLFPLARGLRLSPELAALALLIGVRLWVIGFTPMMLWTDSALYTHHAKIFWDSGKVEDGGFHFMPGYPVFLSPFVGLFENYTLPLGLVQAAMGVASAWLCFLILRPVVGRWWAIAGMLLLGLDPDIISFERWVLTETLGLFLVMLIAYLASREARRDPRKLGGVAGSLASALALGLFCAAAVYVRSALQVLIVLIPVMLLAMRLPRLRILYTVQAVIVGVVAIGLLHPWMSSAKEQHGRYAMALSMNFTKIQCAQMSGVIDENQTTAFDRDRWLSIDRQFREGRMSAWNFANEVRSGEAFPRPEGSLTWINHRELVNGYITDESYARKRSARVRAFIIAATTNLGLWTKWDHPRTNINIVEFTAPFRGRYWTDSNIPAPGVNRPWAETDLGPRAERTLDHLKGSASAGYFEEWVYAWRLLRPIVGLLFLVGLVSSFFSRRYEVFSLAMIAVACAMAVALLTLCAVERYRSMITGLLVIVAIFGCAGLGRLFSGGPTPTQSHDSSPPLSPGGPAGEDAQAFEGVR